MVLDKLRREARSRQGTRRDFKTIRAQARPQSLQNKDDMVFHKTAIARSAHARRHSGPVQSSKLCSTSVMNAASHRCVEGCAL